MTAAYDFDRVHWNLFTGRAAPRFDAGAVRTRVEGKRILVTGAGGFIGSALAKALAQFGPDELILLDLAEAGLYQLGRDLADATAGPKIRLVVGSICDPPLIQELFNRHRPDIVFHAAACKHVPLMEANPFTAASTNVLGTQLILEAASRASAEQCILLSTDKAVDPASIMGATKRVAELIFLAERGYTVAKALRLGNVLGSTGSVAPLFIDQISRGGPVTVAHPEAIRYFLTVDEAVQHLLSALLVEVSSAILFPEMGEPHRIHDLAHFLVSQQRTRSSDIEIVFTGLRPGDKLAESMTSKNESLAQAADGLHVVQPFCPSESELLDNIAAIADAVSRRDLNQLLKAIRTLVPEYHPSHLLRSAAEVLPGARWP